MADKNCLFNCLFYSKAAGNVLTENSNSNSNSQKQIETKSFGRLVGCFLSTTGWKVNDYKQNCQQLYLPMTKSIQCARNYSMRYKLFPRLIAFCQRTFPGRHFGCCFVYGKAKTMGRRGAMWQWPRNYFRSPETFASQPVNCSWPIRFSNALLEN